MTPIKKSPSHRVIIRFYKPNLYTGKIITDTFRLFIFVEELNITINAGINFLFIFPETTSKVSVMHTRSEVHNSIPGAGQAVDIPWNQQTQYPQMDIYHKYVNVWLNNQYALVFNLILNT